MDVLRQLSEELTARRTEMETLRDFHQSLEDARGDDLRIYWDVRIVRGKDTPFHSVKGISTMPNVLSSKMLAHAPSMIQQEVMDKIAQPLTAVFMREGEIRVFESLPLLESKQSTGEAAATPGGGDAVRKTADEIGDGPVPYDPGGDDDV